MRKKIMIYFIILIVTGMSITGFFVVEHARNLYKDNVRERIETVALLFDNELLRVNKNGEQQDYKAITNDYAQILSDEFRINIIDFQGNVLGDSQTDIDNIQNHLDRPEIKQAINGTTGVDTRFSSTLKMNFLYIAIPSSIPDLVIRVSVPLDQLRKINANILKYSFIGMLAGLLLTGLLAFQFASDLSKPVKDLTSAAKEIADGNYSKRVVIQKHDEVGQLAATFNGMAGKLDKTVTELTNRNIQFDAILNSMTNCVVAVNSKMRVIFINDLTANSFGISKDKAIGRKLVEVIRSRKINSIIQQTVATNTSSVTEITLGAPVSGTFSVYASPIHANPIELSDEKDMNSGGIISIYDVTEMKKLEKIRTEFVSNVTHELKTPLTSIRGFVETLRNGAISNLEIASKFLEIIDIEAERLTMLINDILQLSEIENSHEDVNTNQDLTEIITEVVSFLQMPADKKGITVNVSTDPKILIKANRNRIKQMLINLIDNAIKYNKDNGRVDVKAAKSEGRIRISISDTGIGINEQHHSRIFERFYRVDKGRSRNMGGTGLGLSIVKHIVNMYNGDITIESEPGNGTRFIIQLPA